MTSFSELMRTHEYTGNADFGAEGTNERVLTLNTDDCRVQEELRKVIPWRKDMMLNVSLR